MQYSAACSNGYFHFSICLLALLMVMTVTDTVLCEFAFSDTVSGTSLMPKSA